ncbi:MAG: hypothetical protein Kow0075_09390 [Salibacteraceae bacterium]
MIENRKPDPREQGKLVWKYLTAQWDEITGFLHAFFGGFGRQVSRARWYVVGGLLVGLLTGWVLYGTTDPRYEARGTFSYKLLTKKVYGEMLSRLDEALRQKDHQSVNKLMKINQESLMYLKRVKGENILGVPLIKDASFDQTPFVVRVWISNPAHLDSIEKGIVHYLNSPAYVRERLKYNIDMYTGQIAELNEDLERLLIDRELMTAAELDDPKALAEIEGLILQTRQQLLEKKAALRFNENVTALDGFMISEYPWWRNPYWLFIACAFVGVVAGLLLSLVIMPGSHPTTDDPPAD